MRGPVIVTGFADEIASDTGEQIAGLQAAGVTHIEVRGVNGTNVLDLSDDAAGIAASCIGSPIGKVQIRADLDEHFQHFQVALRRADQFGCHLVRLFSFYHEGEEPAAVRDLVVAQLQRMTAAAAAANMTLLHENERDIYGDTPERCLDLLAAVGDPHLQAAFDPGNFAALGVDTRAAWKLLADRVSYFHIKDAEVEPILQAALACGYAGYLSVEPHLKENDPDYGGGGAERFMLATRALRAILHRLGAIETTA
ncbi:MAG: TIM barrel protein [bacterium]|nr:TIM barrel protein [bacterium]